MVWGEGRAGGIEQAKTQILDFLRTAIAAPSKFEQMVGTILGQWRIILSAKLWRDFLAEFRTAVSVRM